MENIRTLLSFYLRAIWRRKWLAAGTCWAVCVVGWMFVYFIPGTYQSQARVYINIQGLLAPLLQGLAVDTDPGQQLDYMHRTLLSRPNLAQIAHLADLDEKAVTKGESELLLNNLARKIDVAVQGEHLFNISYEDPNPTVARNVVQAVLTVFSENSAGSKAADIANAEKFLSQQIANYESQLRAAEERRAAFRQAHADILPEIGTIGSKLDSIRREVEHDKSSLVDATARRDVIQKELESVPQFLSLDQPGYGGARTSDAQTRLDDARRKLAELLTHYTEAYPDVAIARRDIASLERQVAEERTGSDRTPRGSGARHSSVANALYEQLKLRLSDQESTVAAVTRQLHDAESEQKRLEAVMGATPGIELEAQNLDRDYAVIKKNYEELIARRESAHLAQAADVDTDKGQFRVIDAPIVPIEPIAPNRPLLYSGVLIVGLAAGIGLVLFLVQLDRSFSTMAGLRTLGLPVLGTVSTINFVGTRRRLVREAAGVGAALAVLVFVYVALLATSLHPHLGVV